MEVPFLSLLILCTLEELRREKVHGDRTSLGIQFHRINPHRIGRWEVITLSFDSVFSRTIKLPIPRLETTVHWDIRVVPLSQTEDQNDQEGSP